MAKQPQRPSVQQEVAQRITRLMQKNPTPGRMTIEVENIIAGLREQGDEEQVRGWLEEMRDGFAEAAEQAVEAIDEVEVTKKAERRMAENAAACMAAIRDAFARALAEPVAA